MDGEPSQKLSGNIGYWAKRMPKTFAKNKERFIEEAQKESSGRYRGIAKDIIRPDVLINTDEVLKMREFYREAHEQLEPWLKPSIEIRDIIYAVCQETKLTKEQLVGERRTKHLVRARACVAVLGRCAKFSLTDIGRELGGRDHSTVISAVRNYCDDVELQRVVSTVAEVLEIELGGTNQ